jgi:HEAT repeat protein
MTRSPNPEDRALGLNRLVNSGIADPATLDAAIQAGLADADGEVRAEALSSSVRLRLQEGPSRIEQGLQDANASVRLAAVDSLKPDERGRQLLQERLADEDPAVRSLARMKLGILP